jgi:hypothetical protein
MVHETKVNSLKIHLYNAMKSLTIRVFRTFRMNKTKTNSLGRQKKNEAINPVLFLFRLKFSSSIFLDGIFADRILQMAFLQMAFWVPHSLASPRHHFTKVKEI